MKITEIYQEIKDIGKSVNEKQIEISVSEVWHITQHLQMRYAVLETTKILKNYANSPDLRWLLDHGIEVLEYQVRDLESLMEEYGIPMPVRPPVDVVVPANLEIIDDRYVFRRVFRGIQSIFPILASAFTQSPMPKIRARFKNYLLQEIELYDKLIEYGKMKGFEYIPPRYTN